MPRTFTLVDKCNKELERSKNLISAAVWNTVRGAEAFVDQERLKAFLTFSRLVTSTLTCDAIPLFKSGRTASLMSNIRILEGCSRLASRCRTIQPLGATERRLRSIGETYQEIRFLRQLYIYFRSLEEGKVSRLKANC